LRLVIKKDFVNEEDLAIKKDIAGISIADDGISVRFGQLQLGTKEKPVDPTDISSLKIGFEGGLDDNYQPRIPIERGINPQHIFDFLIESIFERFPDLTSIGVGSYGPFTASVPIKNENKVNLVSYTELGQTAENRPLSNFNLSEIIQNSLKKCGKEHVCFCIQTDVAVDSLGYIHEFESSKLAKETTAALIRADNGVGGTFMHMNDSNAWHGVSHTEVGQINVQPWLEEGDLRLHRGLYTKAINPFSVEGLASIPAIEHYFEASFETLRKDPNHIAWSREAWYLAQLAWAFTCFVAPTSIVFCGSIFTVPELLDKVRTNFDEIKVENNNGQSLPYYSELGNTEKYIDGQLIGKRNKVIEIKSPANRGTLCLAAMTWHLLNPEALS